MNRMHAKRWPAAAQALVGAVAALSLLCLSACAPKDESGASADSTASEPSSTPETGATSAAPAPVATPVGSPAEVAGFVKFNGEAPERKPIQMRADPKCVAIHAGAEVLNNETIVGAAGEIENVFVFLRDTPAGDYPPPATPAKLDQVGCLYTPHVQGMIVGQALDVVNSDNLTHNVRCFGRKNPPFNWGQPAPGTRSTTMRKAEEAVKFKCDVHPWMISYIFVMEHPFFAATASDGKFSIPNVPPGKHTLVAWHERLGEQEIEIEVTGDPVTADFSFDAP